MNSIVSFFKYADSRFKSIFVIELYAQYTLLKLTVVYDADILDVDAVEGLKACKHCNTACLIGNIDKYLVEILADFGTGQCE